ncbi:unnamed protein product [Hyaloperonospora brassicae]|uniref:Uncharacterized protein n=1 Tax=Hyaloperonospora brassicae TaxID=162125 RepID=A0AAV0U8C0_HYABA|nr:unnamed protein product [Hyaloperonospora brassicae]
MPPADDDSDVPLPPPPPFPPPPQARSEDDSKPNRRPLQSSGQVQKPKKRKDFREILALFHDESMDAAQVERVWSALWQTTLVESQEDHKRHHHQQEQENRSLKRKKSGDRDHGPVAARDALARHSNLAKDSFKRARQSSSASTDSSESGKASRLGGRFSKNVSKGPKMLQKFGGRT